MKNLGSILVGSKKKYVTFTDSIKSNIFRFPPCLFAKTSLLSLRRCLNSFRHQKEQMPKILFLISSGQG